jgi:Mrp family chromosome partitioning ATPase
LPETLKRLAGEADVILLDTPPCVTVTDAGIIAPWADAAVLVLRAGKAEKRTAARAREILRAVGAPPLGVILNGANVAATGYSYHRGGVAAVGAHPGKATRGRYAVDEVMA